MTPPESIAELAAQPLDDVDEQVLGMLREMFDQYDPPPADLAESVGIALTLSALDAELAELQQQSTLAVRSSAEPLATDTITFTSSSLNLMVQITVDEDDGSLRIDGWVTGGGVRIDVLQGSWSSSATSDAHGRLMWEGLPRRPLRFLMHPVLANERVVITPVIDIPSTGGQLTSDPSIDDS